MNYDNKHLKNTAFKKKDSTTKSVFNMKPVNCGATQIE